jgi:hypothetical protein
VTARVDANGRFLLGRVAVICPRKPRLTCRVVVRQIAGRRVRILPLDFTIPAGGVSRIRLRLTPASLERLRRRHDARAAVRILAQQADGPVARKRVRVRLLAPRPRHDRPRSRVLTGRAVRDRRALDLAAPPGAGGPATVGGLVAGISDQGPATFADPRFRALGMKTARLVLPYDAMRVRPAQVAAWMNAAAAAGIDPLVAFDHAAGDRCPDAPCRLPSAAEYASGVRAFFAAYPSVHLVTPWNEANHAAEPTAGRPDRAAAYYDAARAVCASCTLVAGDVIDGLGMVAWLRAYRAALHEAPAVWGLHDYYDTTYFRTSGLRDLLATVPGDVWLTETGGIVELRGRDGAVSLPYDESRARASVRLAIETATSFARVRRLYVYQWRAAPGDRFDAGLLRPDGRPRPALAIVQQELGALPGPAAAAVPGVTAAAAAPVPRAAVPGRVSVSPGDPARIAIRCDDARRARCAGRLWVEGETFASGALVNGRPPGDVLRPTALRFSLAAGRSGLLRLKVPAAVARRAAAMGVLRLRLAVAAPGSPFALRSRYVVAARPAAPRPRGR